MTCPGYFPNPKRTCLLLVLMSSFYQFLCSAAENEKPSARFNSDLDSFLLSGHSRKITSLAFSPDGRFLASASEDLTIKIWDISHLRVIKTLVGSSEHVLSLVFDRKGDLLASGTEDGTILVWKANSAWEPFLIAGTGVPIYSLVFSKD